MEVLTQVINTLNTIEVSGKDNLNHLLGCIIALEQLIDEMKRIEDTPNVDAEIVE